MPLSDCIALGGVIVSAGGLAFIWWQVRQTNVSLKLANLGTVLTIERNLADARELFTQAIAEHNKVRDKEEEGSDPFMHSKSAMLARRENYLNAMDRLCACIIRKLIPEKEAKMDYMQNVIDTVKAHSDMFGPDCRHTNIKKVRDRWYDQKSAVEKD